MAPNWFYWLIIAENYGLCTKLDLGWALPRTPTQGAYSAVLPDPLAGLKFGSKLRVEFKLSEAKYEAKYEEVSECVCSSWCSFCLQVVAK